MSTTKWVIDPSHSEIEFKVRHLMISNVTGSFKSFEGEVETDGDDFSNAKISFSAKVDSITTGNEQRDGHLKTGDFFELEKYPEVLFTAQGLKKKSDDEYEIEGDLTIRGVTKKVKLSVEAGGIVKDPWGQTKAGFSVKGKINRKDFGLNWGAVTEAGGVVVSDEVRLSAELEFAKQ